MDIPHFVFPISVTALLCFSHSLAIMNSDSVKICMHAFILGHVYLSMELLGLKAFLIFNMLRNCQTCPKQLPHFKVPLVLYWWFQIPISLHLCLFFFAYSHPCVWEVLPHYFDTHLSDDLILNMFVTCLVLEKYPSSLFIFQFFKKRLSCNNVLADMSLIMYIICIFSYSCVSCFTFWLVAFASTKF